MLKYIIFFLLTLPILSNAQDTTSLPTPIARLVIKDLIDYDAHKELYKLSLNQISLLEKKIVAKDSVISVFNQKQINYLQQIDTEKSKTVIWQQQYTDVNKLYKKERLLRNIERNALLAIVAGMTYLYINK